MQSNYWRFLWGSSLSLISFTAQAALPGPYFGLQVGWGDSQGGISQQDMNSIIQDALGVPYNAFTITSYSTGARSQGVAGRIYIGYQFNCFAAAEFGWAKYPNVPIHAQASGTDLSLASAYIANGTGSIQIDAFDLVGKAILPFRDVFSVYAKAGAAYIEHRGNEQGIVLVAGEQENGANYSINQRFFPTFGLGLSYDFTPHFLADLSWMRIQQIGHPLDIGSTDLVVFGLSYHFGPYC